MTTYLLDWCDPKTIKYANPQECHKYILLARLNVQNEIVFGLMTFTSRSSYEWIYLYEFDSKGFIMHAPVRLGVAEKGLDENKEIADQHISNLGYKLLRRKFIPSELKCFI